MWHFDHTAYLVSVCERGFSFLMRVRAAAASSNAQDTLEVNRRRTSGSARCFPLPVDNFPIPKLKGNSIYFSVLNSAHWQYLPFNYSHQPQHMSVINIYLSYVSYPYTHCPYIFQEGWPQYLLTNTFKLFKYISLEICVLDALFQDRRLKVF